MQRVSHPELLDSDAVPASEVARSLEDLGRINRWFGGVATTQSMVEAVARATRAARFSVLEVAAGFGEVPKIVSQRLARRGIILDVTLLDRLRSHLRPAGRTVAADALALPFRDAAFDLVSCNLFAHHLSPPQVVGFVKEALRVCRRALLINDLIRHPLHLALVYGGFVLMRSPLSRYDGVTSVRGAYTPREMQEMLASALAPLPAARVEITRHYLFRMGVIVWKPVGC